MSDRPLGRRAPTDWRHIERFPLTAATAPAAPTPVVLGVNWYAEFDEPTQDAQGHWWVARDGRLTRVRGGHCVCLKPRGAGDPNAWWDFYDQGAEGACVGFGCSRAMSHFNKRLYFARWLWDKAKASDEWSDTNPGDDNGTSVRAGFEVLRVQGHVAWRENYASFAGDYSARDQLAGVPSDGLSVYRWATKVDDALGALGYAGLDYVDVLNSWGRSYPHLVRMPATVLATLLEQDGEVGLPTDR